MGAGAGAGAVDMAAAFGFFGAAGAAAAPPPSEGMTSHDMYAVALKDARDSAYAMGYRAGLAARPAAAACQVCDERRERNRVLAQRNRDVKKHAAARAAATSYGGKGLAAISAASAPAPSTVGDIQKIADEFSRLSPSSMARIEETLKREGIMGPTDTELVIDTLTEASLARLRERMHEVIASGEEDDSSDELTAEQQEEQRAILGGHYGSATPTPRVEG